MNVCVCILIQTCMFILRFCLYICLCLSIITYCMRLEYTAALNKVESLLSSFFCLTPSSSPTIIQLSVRMSVYIYICMYVCTPAQTECAISTIWSVWGQQQLEVQGLNTSLDNLTYITLIQSFWLVYIAGTCLKRVWSQLPQRSKTGMNFLKFKKEEKNIAPKNVWLWKPNSLKRLDNKSIFRQCEDL